MRTVKEIERIFERIPLDEEKIRAIEQYVIKARIDQVKNHIHFEDFDNQQDWNNDLIAELKKGLTPQGSVTPNKGRHNETK